jgi:hypothetical protein
MKVRKAFIK